MWRLSKRKVGLILLFAANLAATLVVSPCLVALGEPTIGWRIMPYVALAAVVPTQLCFVVGWAAMGQRPWLMRIVPAVIVGLLMQLAVRSTASSQSPDSEDVLVMMVSAAPAAYAFLRPLSAILGWEFGDRPPTQRRGQFHLLDIMGWTAAVAMAIVIAQVFPGPLLWVALCLVCCLVVLAISSAFRRRRLALVFMTASILAAAVALHAVTCYLRAFNALWGLPSMGGLFAAAATVTAANLLALDLLGYRLHRRPRRLATSAQSRVQPESVT
jgi:hypothetical protein